MAQQACGPGRCCCGSEPRSKPKHGGYRKRLTWQDKMALAEPEAVRTFIASATCACGENCFEKVRSRGEQGIQLVCDLRDARVAGMCSLTTNNQDKKHATPTKRRIQLPLLRRKYPTPGCFKKNN